ncbi:MAG: hypothetical protein ACXAC8_19420 [Candidatus Hodarchaeales archaeon]|jgi:hypothetical protein
MNLKREEPVLSPTDFIQKLSEEIDNLLTEYTPGAAGNLFQDMTRGYGKIIKLGVDVHKRKTFIQSEENYGIHSLLFDEILRIIFRLTEKPTGSLVPLIDLLDKPTVYDTHSQGFSMRKYLFYKELLAVLVTRINFPVKYFPTSAVFERDAKILKKIIALENVHAVLKGKCPHCYGIFPASEVEAFTNNEVITCAYCDHSLKAEWQSEDKKK